MKTESQSSKRNLATESGQFPKPDLSMFESREPSERSRKDKPDPASITGVIPIIKFEREEDRAKDQDDSAAGREQ